MTPDEVQTAAVALRQAELDRRPIAPLHTTHPGLSVDDAYRIQRAYARLRAQAGAKVVGYKVGATSRAAQQFFGVDSPDLGHLFDDMEYGRGAVVPLSDLIAPMVEAEFGFVLGRDVDRRATVADVLAATEAILPCLEIIDSRVRDWDIALVDTVADNGSSARFVVGPHAAVPSASKLAATAVTVVHNGEVVGTTTGDAVLGNPANAVMWLATTLAQMGVGLPAGSLVLSGSVMPAIPCRPGDNVEAMFAGLGSVNCSFK